MMRMREKVSVPVWFILCLFLSIFIFIGMSFYLALFLLLQELEEFEAPVRSSASWLLFFSSVALVLLLILLREWLRCPSLDGSKK